MICMRFIDGYLVDEGTVRPDLFIAVNDNLSMILTARLHNNTNLSQVHDMALFCDLCRLRTLTTIMCEIACNCIGSKCAVSY